MDKEARRQELVEKVKEAEARVEARASGNKFDEARETATQFVREHPLATVAGAIGIGLLVGAMFPGGRRLGKKAGEKGAAMAALAADFGMAYAREALDFAGDAAQAGQDKLEDIGDDVAARSRKLRRDAGYAVGSAADSARAISRKAGRELGRTVRDLRNRTTH